MIALGIDPGLKGAVCALTIDPEPDTPPGTTCMIVPTPTEWTRINKKPRRVYDLGGMHRLLAGFEAVALVLVEKQHARPHDGTVSAFSTGYGFGAWCAFLHALRFPYEVIEPKRWRKALGVPELKGVAGKRAIRTACENRLVMAKLSLDVSDAVALALVARGLAKVTPPDLVPKN